MIDEEPTLVELPTAGLKRRGGPNGMAGEERVLVEKLESLRTEHRDLDDAIERMEEGPYIDQLRLRRLKKRKLQLKDFMALIESRLIPDLDA